MLNIGRITIAIRICSRFCMIYHLNKPIKLTSDEPPPPPPQRFDSLAAMTSPGGTSRGPPPDLTSQISEIDIT